LFYIKPVLIYKSKSGSNILKDIYDGLKYAASEKSILNIIISLFIIGTFIMNFNVLVPLLAKEGLGLGEKGYGFIWSCMGIGSLAGALIIAVKSRRKQKNIILTLFPFAVSLLFILVRFTNNLYISSALLSTIGFLVVAFMVTANTTLQLQSKDEFRSRIISLYMLVNAGTTPIGNLLTGGMSHIFGIKSCFMILGIGVFLLLAVQYYFKPGKRRVEG
jgi:predicted MFS family arabinose efflux permease